MQCRLCFLALLTLPFISGCGPELSQDDLGTVIYAVPKVAGSEEPYPMPQLTPPFSEEKSKNRPGHDPEKR